MDKTVDALNRVYRAMLLVCGAILLLLIGTPHDPLANTHALEALTALQQAHADLALEMSAKLRDYYAQVFTLAAKGTTKESYVASSRFSSEAMRLVWHPEGNPGSAKDVANDVTLDSAMVLVGDLISFVNYPSYALLPKFKLEPEDLQRVLSLFDGVNPALNNKQGNFEISWHNSLPKFELEPEDLQRVLGRFDGVNPALNDKQGNIEISGNNQLGSCTLTLTYYWPKDENDLPRGPPLPCKLESWVPVPVSEFQMSWGNVRLGSAIQTLLPMGGLTAAQARNELKVLSRLEIAHNSEEIELFGLKLRKDYLAIFGPTILVLLFLQMLVYVGVLRKWGSDPLAAATVASWSRQFDGFLKPLFMSASVVVLPAFVCFWSTSSQTTMPMTLAWVPEWGLFFVLPVLLALIFLERNVRLAKQVAVAAKVVSVEVLSLVPGADVGPRVLVQGSSLPTGSLVALYVREGSGSWMRQGEPRYQGRLWNAEARFGDDATAVGTPFTVVALARPPDDPAAATFDDRLDTLPATSVSNLVPVSRKGP